jgi:hypothetical protein
VKWRAYRLDDPDDPGDEPALGFFCPGCSEAEFG